MQQAVFIRLETTLEKAMYYRNSPDMNVYSFRGVQLLPNNIYSYIQRTYSTDGIEIENPSEVYVCDMCGNRLYDIADYFGIVNVFNDPLTGLPQVDWSLTNVQFDAGDQMVYLEIIQGVDATFYSSPFQLTAENSEYTALWHYRNRINDQMLSIQLQTWFKQLMDFEDLVTYDTVSLSQRVKKTGTLIPYELWTTSIIDINLFRTFKQMRRNKFVYCDFAKTIPFEPFETPKLVGRENFAESEFTLCRDEGNKYDPFFVPIVPPPPPPDPPFINLIRVDSVNPKNVLYVFEYGGFDPTYLQYQYSLDGENWDSNSNSPESPQPIPLIGHLDTPYKYRIYYPPLNLYSNEVLLSEPELVITNITSPQTGFVQIGNNYNIFFNATGFAPTGNISVYVSTDNINFIGLSATGVTSPKSIQTPSSGLEFKYFQLRYNPLGLTSNVFNFEF